MLSEIKFLLCSTIFAPEMPQKKFCCHVCDSLLSCGSCVCLFVGHLLTYVTIPKANGSHMPVFNANAIHSN